MSKIGQMVTFLSCNTEEFKKKIKFNDQSGNLFDSICLDLIYDGWGASIGPIGSFSKDGVFIVVKNNTDCVSVFAEAYFGEDRYVASCLFSNKENAIWLIRKITDEAMRIGEMYDGFGNRKK